MCKHNCCGFDCPRCVADKRKGLQMRDQFAMAALQGMLAHEYLDKEYVATRAYKFADAMLAERGSDD